MSHFPTGCGPETCTAASASRASSTARSASSRRMPSSTRESTLMEHAPAVAALTHTPARMRGSTRHAAARPKPVLRGGGGGVGDQQASSSDASRSASRSSRARALGGDHVGSDSASVALPSSSLGSEMDGCGRCGGRGGGVVGAFARGEHLPSTRGRSRGSMGGVVGGAWGAPASCPQGMRGTPGSGLRACSINRDRQQARIPPPGVPRIPVGQDAARTPDAVRRRQRALACPAPVWQRTACPAATAAWTREQQRQAVRSLHTHGTPAGTRARHRTPHTARGGGPSPHPLI